MSISTGTAVQKDPNLLLQAAGLLNFRQFGAVGDGVHDDTAAWQAGLAALAAQGGGRITGPAGATYNVSSTVTQSGLNNAVVDLNGGKLNCTGTGIVVLEITDSTNVRVIKGRLGFATTPVTRTANAALSFQGCTTAYAVGVLVLSSSGAGIAFQAGCTNTHAEGCYVTGTLADGITNINGVQGAFASHCYVTGSGDDGISVVSYSTATAAIVGVTVDDCQVYNSAAGGVTVVGATDAVVNACVVVETTAEGIRMGLDSTYGTYPVIRGKIRGCAVDGAGQYGTGGTTAGHGIYVMNTGTTDIEVEGCTAYNSVLQGIYVYGGVSLVKVRGCKALSNGKNGIYVYDGFSDVDVIDCTATGNQEDGISMVSGTRGRIELNKSWNNAASQGASLRNIDVEEMTTVWVVQNKCIDTLGYVQKSILITTSTGVEFDDNVPTVNGAWSVEFSGSTVPETVWPGSQTPWASPFVSGTVYQNAYGFPVTIYLPVYATTSGTAGTVAVALGSGSSPSTIFTKYVNGSTATGETDIVVVRVPTGYYVSFTTSGVTMKAATVEGEL